MTSNKTQYDIIRQVLVLNTNSKGIVQIEWCPTRAGILAVASKEEPNIKLWNVKDAFAQVIQMKEGSPEAIAASESLTKPTRSIYLYKHQTYTPLPTHSLSLSFSSFDMHFS
jgi:hypothetical protein